MTKRIAILVIMLLSVAGCSANGGGGFPAPAPNPKHTADNPPAKGGEPHPRKADPPPAQNSNVKTPVTFRCIWFAKLWIEYTVTIGDDIKPTKEKKYEDSNGGAYEETHGVEPGKVVSLDCKLMEDQEGEFPKSIQCAISAFGKVLQGGGYQRANNRVHCWATV